MQFIVEFQADRLIHAYDVVRVEIAEPESLLGSVGESLLRVNRERHDQGLAPDGTRWKERSPMTIGSQTWTRQRDSFRKSGQMSIDQARKVRGRRILYDNGDMLGSFNYQVGSGELKLGFGDRKAAWHHFGTGTFGPRGSAYEIRPKVAKALAFGGLVRKRVTHPGIPARPLVGFPDSDQRLVGRVIQGHLTDAINGAR